MILKKAKMLRHKKQLSEMKKETKKKEFTRTIESK